MYAIVEVGGRQWKVEPGARLDVNRLPAAVGAQHVVDRVLLAQNGERLHIGRPYVSGAKVICEVLEHRLGPKALSYHFRRRENWRKTVGHRQPLTHLVVKEIIFGEGVASGPVTGQAKPSARAASAPGKASATKPRAAGTRTKKSVPTKE